MSLTPKSKPYLKICKSESKSVGITKKRGQRSRETVHLSDLTGIKNPGAIGIKFCAHNAHNLEKTQSQKYESKTLKEKIRQKGCSSFIPERLLR